jgi:DNA polymerase-2
MNAKKTAEAQLVEAWILDLMVAADGITLWLKQRDGNVFPAFFRYYPTFYAALPASFRISSIGFQGNKTRDEIYTYYQQQLGEHVQIRHIEVCRRRVHAEDPEPSPVLQIQVINPRSFKKVIQFVRELEVFDLYNTDLPMSQMFLYEHKLFPFAFCEFKIRVTETRTEILGIILRDSNEQIFYDLPPLRVVWLELESSGTRLKITKSDQLVEAKITQDPCSVPLEWKRLFSPENLSVDHHGSPQVRIRGSTERETLLQLQHAIKMIDPDVIFTSYGDEEVFPYLLARASYLQLDKAFSLSRDGTPLVHTRFQVEGVTSFMSYGQVYHRASTQFYLNGRLHIDSAIYGGLHFDDGNLYGIAEVGRVAYVPLQRLTRITIGGALQSLQFFHAYNLGILVPEEKKNAEFFRSGAALLLSDRGGHILQPEIGIFEQIGELDYTSMYPALMCRYNVSPETLNCPCCQEDGIRVPGLPYHTCKKRSGIVPLSLQVPLTKRIRYKALSKGEDAVSAQKYKKMEEALKWILVVCFGYLGFRNARFGRIEAHQAVCAFAREFLLTAKELLESRGFRAIHGIVDSVWVQSTVPCDDEAFDRRCVELATAIQTATDIPISYSPKGDHFRFICFLPTKQDPTVGALNRYWGKKRDGSIKVRGVELRRHDAPPFIKQFQMDLIEAVGSAAQHRDMLRLMRENLFPVVGRYFQQLEHRQIPPDELAITVRVTREPMQYKVQNYQAIAATYLECVGVPVHAGQQVSFIITNDHAENPLERVRPLAMYDATRHHYDIPKYKELLIRALTNLLPMPFSDAEKFQLSTLTGKEIGQCRPLQQTLIGFFPGLKSK